MTDACTRNLLQCQRFLTNINSAFKHVFTSFENVINTITRKNNAVHVSMNMEFGFQTKFLVI